MPYFTGEHIQTALAYLAESTHPTLMSFLSMTYAGVPRRVEGEDGNPIHPGVQFGGPQDRAMLQEFFSPPGATEYMPYYSPLGQPVVGLSRWRSK